jgi:hypothetical protein
VSVAGQVSLPRRHNPQKATHAVAYMATFGGDGSLRVWARTARRCWTVTGSRGGLVEDAGALVVTARLKRETSLSPSGHGTSWIVCHACRPERTLCVLAPPSTPTLWERNNRRSVAVVGSRLDSGMLFSSHHFIQSANALPYVVRVLAAKLSSSALSYSAICFGDCVACSTRRFARAWGEIQKNRRWCAGTLGRKGLGI